MTNYERIHSMNIEQLAFFLAVMFRSRGNTKAFVLLQRQALAWLKEEVDDDLEETEREDAGFGSTGR